MLESFIKGFKMIGASIKMGFCEKRLLLPSVLTVLTNILFGLILLLFAVNKVGTQGVQAVQNSVEPTFGLLKHTPKQFNMLEMAGQLGLNGPMDPAGFGSGIHAIFNSDTWLIVVATIVIWWLTNRILEGITMAMVYYHLTDGNGAGHFSKAFAAVFASLPAIIVLGMVTLIAKTIARFLRNKRTAGVMGFGFNLLAGIVEVFWTLAGHLILPAIVIEGTSFWGGMKRADRIAQSNLLTIGVGEVGVDGICRFISWLIYLAGVGGYYYLNYQHITMSSPIAIIATVVWAIAVVAVTAGSIYVRAAFYTCLYVWAINAEQVRDVERKQITPPAPLAYALA